jgi:hypothetical protein
MKATRGFLFSNGTSIIVPCVVASSASARAFIALSTTALAAPICTNLRLLHDPDPGFRSSAFIRSSSVLIFIIGSDFYVLVFTSPAQLSINAARRTARLHTENQIAEQSNSKDPHSQFAVSPKSQESVIRPEISQEIATLWFGDEIRGPGYPCQPHSSAHD